MSLNTVNQSKNKLKHLVIVGGQYAGYHLLQQVKNHFRVTLIDKKSFFEWSTSTPHSIHVKGNFEEMAVNLHKSVNEDRVFGENVSYVQALLDEVVDDNTIKVKSTEGVGKGDGIESINTEELNFDYLALCTGHTYNINDSPEEVYHTFNEKDRSEFFDRYREKIDQAESVLVVGGGSTGVETVGEVLMKYGDDKKVGLATNTSSVLEQFPDQIQTEAIQHFEKQGVNFHFDTYFKPDSALAKSYDFIINCVGTRIMTPFLDQNFSEFKNERGSIYVNEYHQVTNKNPLDDSVPEEGVKTYENIFSFGDVCQTSLNEPKNIPALTKQSLIVSNNLIKSLEGDKEGFKKIPDQNFFFGAVYFDDKLGAVAMGDDVVMNPNMFEEKLDYNVPFFSVLKNQPEGNGIYEEYLKMFQ